MKGRGWLDRPSVGRCVNRSRPSVRRPVRRSARPPILPSLPSVCVSVHRSVCQSVPSVGPSVGRYVNRSHPSARLSVPSVCQLGRPSVRRSPSVGLFVGPVHWSVGPSFRPARRSVRPVGRSVGRSVFSSVRPFRSFGSEAKRQRTTPQKPIRRRIS